MQITDKGKIGHPADDTLDPCPAVDGHRRAPVGGPIGTTPGGDPAPPNAGAVRRCNGTCNSDSDESPGGAGGDAVPTAGGTWRMKGQLKNSCCQNLLIFFSKRLVGY